MEMIKQQKTTLLSSEYSWWIRLDRTGLLDATLKLHFDVGVPEIVAEVAGSAPAELATEMLQVERNLSWMLEK